MNIANSKTLVALAATLFVIAPAPAQDAPKLDSPKDKASYAIGVSVGSSLQRQFGPNDINLDLLVRGLRDRAAGTNTAIPEAEAGPAIMAYQTEVQKSKAEGNKQAGVTFLAENAKKDGVKTTASGLQYKVLTAGSGAVPKSNDTVTVNYRGTLIDGTEFDSSYKRGQPASFPVTGVIKGWTEALLMMPVGSKWQLAIPSELAYGDRQAGPQIPPGATLQFEVELVSIKQVEPITSDIIKVPSAEEMKKGAKIETIKAEDLKKYEEEARKQSGQSTNK